MTTLAEARKAARLALDPYKDMTSMAYRYAPDGGATDYTKDGNLHNLPGCALARAIRTPPIGSAATARWTT